MCGRWQHLELSLTPLPLRLNAPNNNPLNSNQLDGDQEGVRAPIEAHSSYRGDDWSPTSLVFHQNLESFAERVGLIVALQSNGKLSQEQAYDQIRKIWKKLSESKKDLLI